MRGLKSIMKLNIKKLGPVSDSEIEFGDVTLFLGPPNTGKSYTLRTIYAKLFLLDDYALKVMKEKLLERLTIYLEHAFPEQALSRLQDLFKAIVKIVLAVASLSDRNRIRSDFEKVFSALMESARLKGTIEWRKDFLVVNIEVPSVSMTLNTSVLRQAMQESLYDFITELIPVEDADSVTFKPTELSRIDINFNFIEKTREHITPISTRRLLLLRLEEFFKYIEDYVLRKGELKPYRWEHYERYLSSFITRYLRYILVVPVARISIKPSIDRLKLSSTIVLKLRLHARSPIPRSRFSAGIELDDIERAVDDVFEKAKNYPILERKIARIVDLIRNIIVKMFTDSLSESVLYEIHEVLKSRLGLNGLRFIPFGRSIFVLGLESASKEPFTRSEFLHNSIKEFYSSVFTSYVYWASKGRSRLLEGKLSEEQARLLEAVTPLLEGKLSTGASERLLYRDWRGSVVDFQLSSALVEEVSGLVFPLLSVDGNTVVLVEEPEVQLHPGAQIVMALFLASLPGLCRCKVVASTHSDLLAITLSQLVVQKPSKEWVKNLLARLLPHVKEGIDVLAGVVAEAVGSFDLKIYEFTRKGRVKSVKPKDVLGKEVPGISRVIDELTDWAFQLASYRESGKTG